MKMITALSKMKTFLKITSNLRIRNECFSSESSDSIGKSKRETASKSCPSATNIPEVSGLSSKVFQTPSGEVGPRASKSSAYKNPEYFSYNAVSYFEAEIEMAKYRLPQPSAVKT